MPWLAVRICPNICGELQLKLTSHYHYYSPARGSPAARQSSLAAGVFLDRVASLLVFHTPTRSGTAIRDGFASSNNSRHDQERAIRDKQR